VFKSETIRTKKHELNNIFVFATLLIFLQRLLSTYLKHSKYVFNFLEIIFNEKWQDASISVVLLLLRVATPFWRYVVADCPQKKANDLSTAHFAVYSGRS